MLKLSKKVRNLFLKSTSSKKITHNKNQFLGGWHFLESLKNTHHMLLNKTSKNKAGTGSQSISFPNTGHTKKRAEKRKKTCGV